MVTLSETVAVLVQDMPSQSLYVKLSLPAQWAVGMYVKLPFPFSVRLPWEGPLTRVALSAAFPMSISLLMTPVEAVFVRVLSWRML